MISNTAALFVAFAAFLSSTTTLAQPATGATCQICNASGYTYVNLTGVPVGSGDYNDCEGGFLDNLRGQCGGNVINWGCTNEGSGTFDTHFQLPNGPNQGCTINAISASQSGLSIACTTSDAC